MGSFDLYIYKVNLLQGEIIPPSEMFVFWDTISNKPV